MTTINQNIKNTIKLSKHFFFEFDPLLLEKAKQFENFLGWEYATGFLRSSVIQKYFPESNVTFYPITKTCLQESCIVKNIEIAFEHFSHFKNSHILIDWPEEINPILPSVIKSFPQCITITSKEQLENKISNSENESLLDKIQYNPIVFMESLDTKRYLLKLIHNDCLSIHCIGGIENILQWQLSQNSQTNSSNQTELILSGALTTWLQANLETEESPLIKQNSFIKNETEIACKNIFQFIQKNSDEKIINAKNIEKRPKSGFIAAILH